MNKEAILSSIKKVREVSPKRNFNQTFDLIVNLKNLNIKKPEEKVEQYIHLHFPKGKKPKICALVDKELVAKAKENFDFVVGKDDFPKYQKDKKLVKKLSMSYDYFVAQANLMGEIASTFGKVFGPKGKMPSPKAGCVIPPNADLKLVIKNLSEVCKLITKNDTTIRTSIGLENMKDEEITDNIQTIYTSLLHALPQEKNNIKSIQLKLTMGPLIEITDQGPVLKEKQEKPKKKSEIKTEEVKEEKKKKKPIREEK